MHSCSGCCLRRDRCTVWNMGTRSLATAVFIVSLAACGGKNATTGVCDTDPKPTACSQMCDPSPVAGNTCPTGYHCGDSGTCTAECMAGGVQCPSGQVCTSDGHCVPGNNMPD